MAVLWTLRVGARGVIGLIPVHSKGRTLWAQVEAFDVESVATLQWCLDGGGYPTSRLGRLHRFLLVVPDGFVVDHINRDKLDNRLSNLRVTTQQVNTQNTAGKTTGASRYRGVYFDRRRGRWYAQVKFEGVRHHGGCFGSEAEAATAAEALRAKLFPPPLVLPNVRREHVGLCRRDWSKCVNGHAFTPENTYVHPTHGTKICRICSRAASHKYENARRLRGAA
jgi:hypothetical protein